MYDDLTNRQQEILEYIKRQVQLKGYPPSVREIGKGVGLSSSSTVHAHLSTLEKKGYLRRDPTKPRAIEVTDSTWSSNKYEKEMIDVPIVGKITAGQPILAVQNIEDSFPLPQDFVHANNELFILTVSGESMIDAGILDGDYILVEKNNSVSNGDIVAALLGDEATVKRFFREKDQIRLQPENKFMEPIYAKDVQILGKVIGVFRRIY